MTTDAAVTADAAPKAKRNRRWLQFSLRTLLVLVLVIGCGFGWLAYKIKQAKEQREAVQAIVNSGDLIEYDYEYGQPSGKPTKAIPRGGVWLSNLLGRDFLATVVAVYLAGDYVYVNPSDPDVDFYRIRGITVHTVSPEAIEPLRHLPHLKELHCNWPITDASLVTIAGLAELRVLSLRSNHVSDAGVAELTELTELADVDLAFPRLTDQGMKHLAGLKRLRSLKLENAAITNAALVFHSDKFERLQVLELKHANAITDVGLAHLGGWSGLRALRLDSTRISDAGLVHLGGLRQLKRLSLCGNKLSDAGLSHLLGLANLQELSLSNTQVTDAGVAELQKALPNCKITR